MLGADPDIVNNIITRRIDLESAICRDLYQKEENKTAATEGMEMERIEQREEEEIVRNASEKISHDVLIHNLDTTLTGASAFMNQALDSIV